MFIEMRYNDSLCLGTITVIDPFFELQAEHELHRIVLSLHQLSCQ